MEQDLRYPTSLTVGEAYSRATLSGNDTTPDPTYDNDEAETKDPPDPKTTELLLTLAEDADLFHDPDKRPYADLTIDGHRETCGVRSEHFREWLTLRFYQETGNAPGSAEMAKALGTTIARARYEGPEREVFTRVAGLDGSIYLDLCNDAWQVVEINAAGWRVVDRPPVRFQRANGMRPLPVPREGGSVGKLRPFLNLTSDADFVLVVAWLLAALRDRGPYPVLVLAGEQGSAKSTFARILRSLIDPNKASLRTLTRDERDLHIAATNSYIISFDNLSHLPGSVSDALCRLATGGGFATRQLYSDQGEIIFTAARPVILNGIEDVVTRPDLADRSVFLTLGPIPDEQRRSEGELWEAFEAEQPFILGALLDAVVTGLKRLPGTRLPKLPRMADFALWVTACEAALWAPGTFMAAYEGNRKEVVDDVIEADPVAAAVQSLMDTRQEWPGTADALLKLLTERTKPKPKDWPESPRGLSGRLRRAATFLRKVGIEVRFDRGRSAARTRLITIRRIEGPRSSIPSTVHKASQINDVGLDANADEGQEGTSRTVQAVKH